jgi:hypothetical protein
MRGGEGRENKSVTVAAATVYHVRRLIDVSRKSEAFARSRNNSST